MIPAPYLLYLGHSRDFMGIKTSRGLAIFRPEACVGEFRHDDCPLTLGLPRLTIAEGAAAGGEDPCARHRQFRRDVRRGVARRRSGGAGSGHECGGRPASPVARCAATGCACRGQGTVAVRRPRSARQSRRRHRLCPRGQTVAHCRYRLFDRQDVYDLGTGAWIARARDCRRFPRDRTNRHIDCGRGHPRRCRRLPISFRGPSRC